MVYKAQIHSHSARKPPGNNINNKPSPCPSHPPMHPPTRGHDEHIIRGDPQGLGQGGGTLNGIPVALGTSGGVGLARIRQNLQAFRGGGLVR